MPTETKTETNQHKCEYFLVRTLLDSVQSILVLQTKSIGY